jgi:hypothetical protein
MRLTLITETSRLLNRIEAIDGIIASWEAKRYELLDRLHDLRDGSDVADIYDEAECAAGVRDEPEQLSLPF